MDSARAAAEDTSSKQPQAIASLPPQIDNSSASTANIESTGSTANIESTASTEFTASTKAPDASPSAGNVGAEGQELDTVRLLAKEYLEEINGLQSQNKSLQAEAAELNDETVELNKELLGLELAMTAAESESSQVTETQVIYNIVNVPVGNEAAEVEGTTLPQEQYDESTTLPAEQYDEGTTLPLEQYDERDVIYLDYEEQIAPEAVPFEKLQEDDTDSYNGEPIRWDNSGESVEFVDAYPDD